MEVTLKKFSTWVGAATGVLVLAGLIGTGGMWFFGAHQSHAATEENTKTTKRVVDVLEGVQGILCRDEKRRCIEKAKKEGTDPAECIDIVCKKNDTDPD